IGIQDIGYIAHGQGIIVRINLPHIRKGRCCYVIYINAIAVGTYPCISNFIKSYRGNIPIFQMAFVGWYTIYIYKMVFFPIIYRQPLRSAHPQPVLRVFYNNINIVVCDACFILWVMFITVYPKAIIAYQAIGGANPYITLAIF